MVKYGGVKGVVMVVLALSVELTGQTPQPFPRDNQTARPAQPAAPPAPTAAPPPTSPAALPQGDPASGPTEAQIGAPIYPTAQFITSYDAGRGQRYYLFGTTASYTEMVTYYRTSLKEKGNIVFEQPPTHMFETARFREETMAFPPSVTIKDYTWGGSAGYPNPKRGSQPERFATVIQIVPAPAAAAAPIRR